MERRRKQAAFVAINLRLPPSLHRRLVKAAGATRSLNTEILERLEGSFVLDEISSRHGISREATKKLIERGSLEELTRRVEKLEESVFDKQRQRVVLREDT